MILRDALLAAAAGVLLWVGATGFGRILLADTESSPAGSGKGSDTPPLSPAVENKLDQVMQNDEQILSRFASVIEELQVVKIRVLRSPQQNP